MSSTFSAGLQLTTLDDYLGPSQDCVIQPKAQRVGPGALRGATKGGGGGETEGGEGAVVALEFDMGMEGGLEIGVEDGGVVGMDVGGGVSVLTPSFVRDEATQSVYEIDPSTSVSTLLQPTSISLSDCLACSGCITTAETVLISSQSAARLEEILGSGERPGNLVFSFSTQALCGLATLYSLGSVEEALGRAGGFVVGELGADVVVDTELGRQMGVRCVVEATESSEGPVLTSSCPGWICYVEKTHPELIPHIAGVRSPQALTGAIVAEYLGLDPSETLHVSVMQCYDKKLEASRPEFTGGRRSGNDPEVDIVLTVVEFDALVAKTLGQEKGDLGVVVPLDVEDRSVFPLTDVSALAGRGGVYGASGGFADAVLAARMGEGEMPEFKSVRNKDYAVAGWEDGVKVVTAFGFRNIQNVVQSLAKGSLDSYALVEVQACPSGCLNGGGMPRAEGKGGGSVASRAERREHLNRLRSLYDDARVGIHRLFDDVWAGMGGKGMGMEFVKVDSLASVGGGVSSSATSASSSGLMVQW